MIPLMGAEESKMCGVASTTRIRQPDGHTAPTCLMNIATPTGLARWQVSVKIQNGRPCTVAHVYDKWTLILCLIRTSHVTMTDNPFIPFSDLRSKDLIFPSRRVNDLSCRVLKFPFRLQTSATSQSKFASPLSFHDFRASVLNCRCWCRPRRSRSRAGTPTARCRSDGV